MNYKAAYTFVSGKLAVAIEELRKRGVTFNVSPTLLPLRTSEATSLNDQAGSSQNTRDIILEELKRENTELKAKNEELKQTGSDARECARLKAENKRLSRDLKDVRMEMATMEDNVDANSTASRMESDKLKERIAQLEQQTKILEPALKQVTGERNQLVRQARIAAAGGASDAQIREFNELKSAYRNQERANKSLEAKVVYLDNKVDDFRAAFYNLHEEYCSLTGGSEPGTKLPDEVSRAPRFCVFPVL